MALSHHCCKADSWSLKLYNILRPAPQDSLRVTSALAISYSRLRHSPGYIWKHIFSTSIYNDLACSSSGHDPLYPAFWRRFIRIEHIGLSGVVLYEIPVLLLAESTLAGCLPPTPQQLTLEGAFRSSSDPDTMLDLDDLLDVVGVKMIYFPAYACTSFVADQVMSAFFKNPPGNCRFPAYQGFSIRPGDTNPVGTSTLESLDHAGTNTIATDHNQVDTCKDTSNLSGLNLMALGTKTMIALSLEPDSLYTSLCIRSSTLHHLEHSPAKSDVYYLASTVDPAGRPPLPPPPRPSETFSKSSQNLCIYDNLFSLLHFAPLGDTDR